MYAIIDNGGKQFKVAEGEKIQVDLIPADVGKTVTFERVLLIGGDQLVVGQPVVESAKVETEILSHFKDKKVIVFKKKRRKGYDKKQGHRQQYTELLVKKIVQ